ncbi:MAG: DNA polymerase IV [Methanophagales archaeon]|nr:DNA polymerase IV [Methanophagales archaeon]MCW7070576.1 DNA polymerase IV [Methanophagales archaeon]MCW7072397.1 DNA polymerase IV [Methanophagales archaeon]
MRVILHVDMDSFFSAIEVREHPELKGLPVVVGGVFDTGKIRGVVSTCSYEARKYGIHSAMSLSRAYKLCPDAKFLPVNMRLYKRVSAAIMAILHTQADKMEQVSIDEAYLDISSRVRDWAEARAYAERIKAEIWAKERLTCSIGVAPNKTIAKIASNFVKPDGLTVVEERAAKVFLAPLPVKSIPGVGPKTENILKQMGIFKIGQLANTNVQLLVARLGKYGERIHLIANGIDESDVETACERKSLSRERTFTEDTDDIAIVEKCVEELAYEVHKALETEGFVFKTVGIKVKYADFTVITRAKTLRAFHSDLETLKRIAKELMMGVNAKGKEKKIRLVGVRVSKLSLLDYRQRRLFLFSPPSAY